MRSSQLLEEPLTHSVIGAFHQVYHAPGFGFLEHVYIMALERELRARGHAIKSEMYVPVLYKGEQLTRQRIDMLVDEPLIVEAKATTTARYWGTALRQIHSRISHVSAVSGVPKESWISSRIFS